MDREVTDIMYRIACGLDVHAAVITACLVRSGPNGGPNYEERSFATSLRGLRELRDWLIEANCQMVGMEATGVYWIPVFSVLEGHVPMVVGNPNHMRNLRGHKTDRKDAKWISGLTRHGLIRPSFVPEAEFRDARELTRTRRQLVNARTMVRNEITRLLAHQGIPLGADGCLSDIFGVSGMSILEALAEGRDVMAELPSLLHYSLKQKTELISAALEAGLREVPRSILAMHLGRLESVEEDIKSMEACIEAQLAPHKDKLDLLTTIPGVSLISACVILAEIGVDMTAWPTHHHLSAWGGVAPGCRETGGKSKKAKTRKGNPYLCTTMVECAGGAVLTKGSQFTGTYHHLCARTGSKMKARMAIARKLLVIVFKVLSTLRPYEKPNPKQESQKSRQRRIKRHVRELEKLGFEVHTTPIAVNS